MKTESIAPTVELGMDHFFRYDMCIDTKLFIFDFHLIFNHGKEKDLITNFPASF